MVEQLGPPPTLPGQPPWEDIKALVSRIDKLTSILEAGVGIGAPGAAPTYIGPTYAGVAGIAGAPGTTAQLIAIMQELVPESIGNTAIIPFQKTIPTAYQDEEDRQVPFTGIIRDVLMCFPAGCQQLLEVRLMYYPAGGSYRYVVPTLDDSFVALDDFTVIFQPRFPIMRPGNLRVEWWNYDSLNTHSVPVIATIVPTRLEVKA